MTTTQRVIKYLAIGFACALAFLIIAGIAAAGAGILTGIGVINRSAPEALVDCTKYEKCLSLQISYSELHIKEDGEEIAVESSDDDYEIVQNDKNLIIKDVRKTSWFNNDSRSITITIPESVSFDAVGINGGAGKIEIERIDAKELNLSLGAGETIIKKVKVDNKANIDTGAGRFVIESGEIHDAKVSLGVGDTSIRAAITGGSKVDAGIGSVNLDLMLPASEYMIKVDKGIGEVEFNGASVSSGMVVQGGENKIDIDGGIGKIIIRTASEK